MFWRININYLHVPKLDTNMIVKTEWDGTYWMPDIYLLNEYLLGRADSLRSLANIFYNKI